MSLAEPSSRGKRSTLLRVKLTAVSCENCGAPLKVREDARFVTCAHCETQLKIDRTEGAVSTIVLEEKVAELADDVDELRVEAAVARLDREWAEERERAMIRTRDGTLVVPLERNGTTSIYLAIVGALAFCGMGWWMLSLPGRHSDAAPMMLLAFAVLIGVVGVSSGNRVIRQARAYSAAEERYRERRERLLERER
jgi:uncharacterized Zn finger protein (UPF0148 family)